MKKSENGFSLVELVVVIGIIVILAGIISVGVSKLQANGKRTKCMNNIRAFGTELVNYLDDNQGKFPVKTDIDNPRAWFNILPERLKRTRMTDLSIPQQEEFAVRIPNDNDFICPSMTYERAPNQAYYSSYAINADLVKMGEKARIQNIIDPTYYIFLCETPTPDKPKVDLDTITSHNVNRSYRHGDSLVVCFADGHVDFITREAIESENSSYKWNYDEASEGIED